MGKPRSTEIRVICPRSFYEWWSQDWNLGICTITHVLRFVRTQNGSSLQYDNNRHGISGACFVLGSKPRVFQELSPLITTTLQDKPYYPRFCTRVTEPRELKHFARDHTAVPQSS